MLRGKHKLVVVGVTVALIAIGGGIVYRDVVSEGGPIYTVSAVQHGLALAPARWIGHVVRIRGVALTSCGVPGGCLWRPPGVPPFGLVDRPTGDVHLDADLARSLPLHIDWPDPPDQGFPAAVIARAPLLAPLLAPFAQKPVRLVRYAAVYTVRLGVASPCLPENSLTPCFMADLGVGTTAGY